MCFISFFSTYEISYKLTMKSACSIVNMEGSQVPPKCISFSDDRMCLHKQCIRRHFIRVCTICQSTHLGVSSPQWVVMAVWLLIAVPWVCLRSVILVFRDQTLFFLTTVPHFKTLLYYRSRYMFFLNVISTGR